jgi:zinc/manganese transport system substrate-binding protein
MNTALRTIVAIAIACALTAGLDANADLTIVTTTEDLASLVREIGGEAVSVEALARGYQDPHFVEPKPSFILKLTKADLLVVVGRDLEIGWLPPLVQQSRNARIQPGAQGYLDASLMARILDVPTGQVTRAMGDVHALGNPHYWLDPDNGRRISAAILEKLIALRPQRAAFFNERYTGFTRRLAASSERWDALMAPYRGVKVVTYHRSWPNFAERFGLNVIGYVEPRPGIPPTPAHTRDLVQTMIQQRVKLLLVEPYFDLRTPNAIARQAGAQVVELSPSVGGATEAGDYFALFDHDLGLLVNAIRRTGAHDHDGEHHDHHDGHHAAY